MSCGSWDAKSPHIHSEVWSAGFEPTPSDFVFWVSEIWTIWKLFNSNKCKCMTTSIQQQVSGNVRTEGHREASVVPNIFMKIESTYLLSATVPKHGYYLYPFWLPSVPFESCTPQFLNAQESAEYTEYYLTDKLLTIAHIWITTLEEDSEWWRLVVKNIIITKWI